MSYQNLSNLGISVIFQILETIMEKRVRERSLDFELGSWLIIKIENFK